ncbi:MAG: alpha/beta fold hydrolase [Acidimicrobiales bacterium]
MTTFLRTPDENFAGLASFDFTPRYHQWQDLRLHYLDEGPADGPVMLLLHGMPTWSYLYRDMIPPLTAAGYRCIAPDHMGFGRSDKPTDPHWYTIARHTEILTSLITGLDLTDVTLVGQDWGGPIGLAQAATMPERFSRLVIMNTWLHHPDYDYPQAVRNWNQNWHAGGVFDRLCPDVALVLILTAGLAGPDVILPALVGDAEPGLTGAAADMYRGFAAPFAGLADEAYNGLRRFPLSIPFDDYDSGNGAAQTAHYRALLASAPPTHFIWGVTDDIFPESWGRQWAGQMRASFDPVDGAGHFLQNTHGTRVAAVILERIGRGGAGPA